jgi:hypothetical protein
MPENNSIEQRNLKFAGFSPRIGAFLKEHLELSPGIWLRVAPQDFFLALVPEEIKLRDCVSAQDG